MYSSRLDWSARRNPIAELLDAKRAAGERIIDLTESNPTQAGIVYPSEEIAAAFTDVRALRYDPNPAGLLTAREEVSKYYAERGVDVSPERLLLTASTSEGYAWLFKLLADPGEEILAPRPSYPLFEYLAKLESVRVVQYPLFYDHGWHIDIGAIDALVTTKTRAIVLVNPNNPTGSFVKRGELAALIEICARRGLALISDEVFADYALRDDASRVATLAGVEDVPVFVLSGLSKVAGLPQMKLAWMLVNRTGAFEKLELIADTYLSAGTPVQVALPKLMALRDGIQRQIRERTGASLAWLRNAIPKHSASRLLDVEGGWYATLQVPRVRSEEEWALDLLRRENVLVQPGYYYDFESEAYLVLSLLADYERNSGTFGFL